MLPETSFEELTLALDACVADLLEGQGVFRPPIDALEIAAQLGMDVAWDAGQSGRARVVQSRSAQRSAPRHTVLVRPEPRPERIQWAVAHEIGETLAHRVFEDLAVDPREVSPSAREQIANQLAARLLLPKTWFAVDAAACGWDLAALKLRYATASHELIARRMLDFPDAVVITIFDQGVPRFRRASWGRQASPLRPLELDCRRVVHTTGRPDRRSDEVSTVRGWPVHEPEWKREILRLEWNDAED